MLSCSKIAKLIREKCAEELDVYPEDILVGIRTQDDFIDMFEHEGRFRFSTEEWIEAGVERLDDKTWRKICTIAAIVIDQAVEAYCVLFRTGRM